VNEVTAIVLVIVVCIFVIAVRRATDRVASLRVGGAVLERRSPEWHDAAWKIDRTIEIFRDNLDSDKLAPGKERYTHYYIAYLYEIGRAICVHNEVEYSPMMLTSILSEAVRLYGGGEDELREGERRVTQILASEIGRRGAEEGLADGAYAVDPRNPGPYWQHIAAYFES
jgi:hypothetical protein